MVKHPFRKAVCLTLLYSLIIIGIFVLQFRNESVILRNAGLLRMTVAETQNDDGSVSLKNSLEVSFKGVSFSADENHPALLSVQGNSEAQPLVLSSWEQPSAQSFKFNFAGGISVVFAVSDTTPDANLSINASLPDNALSLSIYYKPVSGYSVTEQSRTRQMFSSKSSSYTMTAAEINESLVTLTSSGNTAMFMRYDPSKAFTFASISPDSVSASAATYEATIKRYRELLLSSAQAAFADSTTLSENTVASYVAEMALNGRYAEGIAAVPDSFKNGARRTYFTAPYFNTLAAMNQSLVMANTNFSSMIRNSLERRSLDAFTADRIDDYLLRFQDSDDVKSLLSLPASIENFQPTLAQASALLHFYALAKSQNSTLSSLLEPCITGILDTITQACSLSSDSLVLQEKGAPVSFLQAIESGAALVEYGTLSGDNDLARGGYMIINTAFANNQNIDLRTMADIYPVLIKGNPAYPHSQLIYSKNTEPVWAWTCASNITYSENSSGTEAEITVSFKQGDTHYIIINGIKPFREIEIYGISFHTDPRFETYNSSGYVYNQQTHTLLLKSRHKSADEKIHLYFSL